MKNSLKLLRLFYFIVYLSLTKMVGGGGYNYSIKMRKEYKKLENLANFVGCFLYA